MLNAFSNIGLTIFLHDDYMEDSRLFKNSLLVLV